MIILGSVHTRSLVSWWMILPRRIHIHTLASFDRNGSVLNFRTQRPWLGKKNRENCSQEGAAVLHCWLSYQQPSFWSVSSISTNGIRLFHAPWLAFNVQHWGFKEWNELDKFIHPGSENYLYLVQLHPQTLLPGMKAAHVNLTWSWSSFQRNWNRLWRSLTSTIFIVSFGKYI